MDSDCHYHSFICISPMMTQEEVDALIKAEEWKNLGFGTYNHVDVSVREISIGGLLSKWVHKTEIPQPTQPSITKKKRDAKLKTVEPTLNNSERAVRKWRDLNPHYPAYKSSFGWIAPYLGEKAATDAQIATKLTDIYLETRNIVADACGHKNFLVVNDEVVCVDVDQALRRGSVASEIVYQNNSELCNSHWEWLDEHDREGKTQTVNVVRALLYLEKHLTKDQIKDEYIQINVIRKLKRFWENREPITVNQMKMLLKVIALDPTNEIESIYITPQLINKLEQLQKRKLPITKETIVGLIDIHSYARFGNIEKVGNLIRQNRLLLDLLDKNRYTPLHIAALYGQTGVVSYLIEERASSNLLAPVPDMISSDLTMTALDLALFANHDDIVLILLKARAKVYSYVTHRTHVIHFFAKRGNTKGVEDLIKWEPTLVNVTNSSLQAPLLLAAAGGHHETVDYLIAQGAEINSVSYVSGEKRARRINDDYTALDWAIYGGHTHTISILTAVGAKTNHVHTTVREKTLKKLIEKGALAHVQILIDHNPSLLEDLSEIGYTPLQMAAYFGQTDILNYFIAKGAALNTLSAMATGIYKDIEFPASSAMDLAIISNQCECVTLLAAAQEALVRLAAKPSSVLQPSVAPERKRKRSSIDNQLGFFSRSEAVPAAVLATDLIDDEEILLMKSSLLLGEDDVFSRSLVS